MTVLKRIALFAALVLAVSPAMAAQGVLCCFSPVGQAPPPTAPVLGAAGNTVTWTQGGAATAIDSSLTVSGTITGARVTITSGFVLGDQLAFTNTGTITGNYNAANGQLALSGTDSAANYQTALRGIKYLSTASTPTNSGVSATRTVTWVGLNLNSGSSGVASTVNVVELPTLAGVAGGTAFTQGAGAVTLSPSITVADFSAANLTSATIRVTATFLSGDTLACVTCGSLTPSYNAGTGVLTLSGTATLAVYQTALASVTYNFSGADVTNGGTNNSRQVTWSVTDSNSNASAAGSATQVFTVTAGGSTQMPSWVPSWAATSSVSCNYTVGGANGQCWNGTNVVAATTYLTTTRATTESCETTNAVTTANPNVPCINANGIGNWPASTNYVWPSDNVNHANWVLFAPAPGSGTASVTASYNTVTGPDLVANDASAITASRSISGNLAVLDNNQITLPASGTYTTSCWVKADSSVYVGTQISMGLFDGVNQATSQIRTITLTANWVRYLMTTPVSSVNKVQLSLGLNPNGSSSQIGTVVFDVWRCQMESGSAMTPSIQTTTAPVTRPIDNILATSTLSSLLAGTTGTYLIQTSGGQNSNTATILDSNGNIFAGEASSGVFTTGLPTSASTITSANWTGTTTVGEAWSAAGKTMALNGSVIYKDASAPVPAVPFHLGSTSGTSAAFTGYVQLFTVAPTRVPDSTIGIAAGGTNYYFSAAGSDSNDCKSTITSCSNNFATAASGGMPGTGAKVNTINYIPADIINLNKGDTFTGCLLANGNGGNVQSVAAQGLTVQAYGSAGARPLVTSQGVQCPGEFNSPSTFTTSATVHINDVSGLLWNGVNVNCDTTGNNPFGVSLENNSSTFSSNVVIENMNVSSGCLSKTGNFNTNGAAIHWNVDGTQFNTGPNGAVIEHVTLQNIVCTNQLGATDQTGPSGCMSGLGYYGIDQIQFDLIQGILVYNLGGTVYPVGCGGSLCADNGVGLFLEGNQSKITPSIVQYVVVHDTAGNTTGGCGNAYAIFTFQTTAMTMQFMELYHNRNAAVGNCDHGGLDIDLSSFNMLAQYIYTHDNSGPGINVFLGSRIGPTMSNVTVRYSIAENDGVNQSAPFNLPGNGTTGAIYIYSNDFIQTNRLGSPPASMQSCPGPGSVYANNIHVATASGVNSNDVALMFDGEVGCTTLTFANNGWWCPNCFSNGSGGATPTGNYFWRWAQPPFRGSAAWQASGVPNGDANSQFAVNPGFTGAIGGNVTCYSATTAPTSDPRLGCPAAYVLAGGSAYKGAGANLTTSPFGFLNVGTHDYYGATIPSGGGSGYSIGASQ